MKKDIFETETAKWIGIALFFTIIIVGHFVTK